MRTLMALTAALAALNAFLLAYPGDVVPQVVLLLIGAANVTSAAVAAYLSRPVPPEPPLPPVF